MVFSHMYLMSLFFFVRELSDVPVKEIVVSQNHLALLLGNGYIYRIQYSLKSNSDGSNRDKKFVYYSLLEVGLFQSCFAFFFFIAMMMEHQQAMFPLDQEAPPLGENKTLLLHTHHLRECCTFF